MDEGRPTGAVAAIDVATDEEAAWISAERFRALEANFLPLLAAGTSGAVVAAAMLWGRIPSGALLGWILVLIAWNAGGYWNLKTQHKHLVANWGPRDWLLSHAIGAGIAGLIWGVGISYAFVHLVPDEKPFPLLVMILVAIGATAANLPSFAAAASLLTALLVPMAFACLTLSSSPSYILVAVEIVLVLAICLRFGYLQDRATATSLLLRFRNERLARTLADANQRLAATSEAKTRFIAAANHDLRQPMQAISLLVGALGGRLEAPGERAILAKIQSSVTALNALFDAILDISKLDAQVIEPSTQVVALNDLLNEIDLYHRASAEAKGLRFRVVVTRAVTRTDRALMIRVLGNLVSNAIRYTNRGGVLIGVRTRSDRWSVEVVDTGSGIPADKLDQIFDEFVQLDNPTHDRSKGLGLGLSIVRRMATLMGHEIAVKSVPGRGSVFSVGLPRVLGPQLRVANLAPLRRTHDVEGAFVAVVDDEKDVLFAMETLLNDWGCRTVSASSGNALIAALDEHARQIDLLITDFRISPTETGVDVIRKVREAQLAEVPAMIVTGSHSAADVHAAEVSGFLVLHKPIMAEHLLAAMSDLMRRQPRGA